MACDAKIIPSVQGSDSEGLDLAAYSIARARFRRGSHNRHDLSGAEPWRRKGPSPALRGSGSKCRCRSPGSIAAGGSGRDGLLDLLLRPRPEPLGDVGIDRMRSHPVCARLVGQLGDADVFEEKAALTRKVG